MWGPRSIDSATAPDVQAGENNALKRAAKKERNIQQEMEQKIIAQKGCESWNICFQFIWSASFANRCKLLIWQTTLNRIPSHTKTHRHTHTHHDIHNHHHHTRPDGMVEWAERLSPVLVDCGMRTHGFEPWLSQTNDVKIDNCRFLVRRSTLLWFTQY